HLVMVRHTLKDLYNKEWKSCSESAILILPFMELMSLTLLANRFCNSIGGDMPSYLLSWLLFTLGILARLLNPDMKSKKCSLRSKNAKNTLFVFLVGSNGYESALQ